MDTYARTRIIERKRQAVEKQLRRCLRGTTKRQRREAIERASTRRPS